MQSIFEGRESDSCGEGAVPKKELGAALRYARGFLSECLGEFVFETDSRVLPYYVRQCLGRELPRAQPDYIHCGTCGKQIRHGACGQGHAGTIVQGYGCLHDFARGGG